MLFSFFLFLLLLAYVFGYIIGWQINYKLIKTTKLPQGGVNDYRKSELLHCLDTLVEISPAAFLTSGTR